MWARIGVALMVVAAAACNANEASLASGDLGLGAAPDALVAALDANAQAALDGNTAPDLAARDGAPNPAMDLAPVGAAACVVPTMDQIYTGALPTNPYAPALAADSCIASPHDAIVVLGCPNNDDGTPASCQTKRADIAVALAAAGWGERFIPTGAAVKNAYVEADTLASLLTARGVAASAIFREPMAKHTDENLYYSTKIMEAHGWVSAWVVSDDPGHLIMTAVCDSNCCVELGRLTVVEVTLGSQKTKVGHYVRYPWATAVGAAECAQIESPLKLMCTNASSRLACADDFKL